MITETALEFLQEHRPLTPQASDELLVEFERVRSYFTSVLDPRAVTLLIGALGDGDGHGIYLMVETALLAYPDNVVIPAIFDGLHSKHASVVRPAKSISTQLADGPAAASSSRS